MNAGEKLDASNYDTSRCAHLVEQCATIHHCGAGYCALTLDSVEVPLKKYIGPRQPLMPLLITIHVYKVNFVII